MALKTPEGPLMMLELAVMSVQDGISLIATQSQTTVPASISPSVICFYSSRPASECITSVPRMGRVPSSGWTGSRAASRMPEAHVRRAREELPSLTGRGRSYQGPRFCILCPLLKQLPCHTGLGRSPGPLPAAFQQDLSGWESENVSRPAAVIS